MEGPLVPCATLAEHLDDPSWRVFDCRTRLGDPTWGDAQHAEAHIPGALRADIDRDLSDPVGDGRRGRHPLPDPDRFLSFLRRTGVDQDVQVVAYDDEGGWWASRMWWLCRDVGLERVGVLDGGFGRWSVLGLPIERHAPAPPKPTHLQARPGHMPVVAADRLPPLLLDARAPERFTGATEPIDAVAGHIPGARNVPAKSLVGLDGRLLGPDELRGRLEEVGVAGEEGAPATPAACYCGSGVTATHLVLAMEVAGLPTPSLYPGSWSGWIAGGGQVEVGAPAAAASPRGPG